MLSCTKRKRLQLMVAPQTPIGDCPYCPWTPLWTSPNPLTSRPQLEILNTLLALSIINVKKLQFNQVLTATHTD